MANVLGLSVILTACRFITTGIQYQVCGKDLKKVGRAVMIENTEGIDAANMLRLTQKGELQEKKRISLK